jgi:hypothetical protein
VGDISLPTLFTEMVAQVAQRVIGHTYWSFTRSVKALNAAVDAKGVLIDTRSMARVSENKMFIVLCNVSGELITPKGNRVLPGRSPLAHPPDRVVVKA